MTSATSEADSAVLRAKPDNAVSSMILIGELLLSSCGSTNRRGCTPRVVTKRLPTPLHRRLIHMVLQLRRAYLSLGHALARRTSTERHRSISRMTLLK